jgi:anti-anti-sigma factor
MMQATFGVQDRCVTISLGGIFDVHAYRDFQLMRRQLQARDDILALELDLAAVMLMDSSALGMLLELRRDVEARGIPIRIRHCSPFVARTLRYANFDRLFDILPD